MKSRWPFVCLLVACVTLCTATIAAPGAAQPTPDEAALQNAQAAEELYNHGQWEKAFKLYSEAETLSHRPRVVLYMARCMEKMGELVAASQLYKRVIDSQLPAAAKRQYTDAQKQAQKQAQEQAQLEARVELEALKKRIPYIWVILTNAKGRNVRITVDGLPQQNIDKPIEVDPGRYKVVIEWDEGKSSPYVVEATEGKGELLTATVPPKAADLAIRKTPTQSTRYWIGPVVGMGVGITLLATGITFATLCTGSRCTNIPEEKKTYQALTTGLSVVGALVFSGSGIVGIIIGSTSSTPSTRTPKKTPRAHVLPVITPAGVFLTGTF